MEIFVLKRIKKVKEPDKTVCQSIKITTLGIVTVWLTDVFKKQREKRTNSEANYFYEVANKQRFTEVLEKGISHKKSFIK